VGCSIQCVALCCNNDMLPYTDYIPKHVMQETPNWVQKTECAVTSVDDPSQRYVTHRVVLTSMAVLQNRDSHVHIWTTSDGRKYGLGGLRVLKPHYCVIKHHSCKNIYE